MLFVHIILFWLFSSTLLSQSTEYKFQQISSNDNLSNSNVHKIFQDKKGFLWFCTEDGLNRYDGYNFTIYKKEPHNSKSLSDDYIYAISEDSSGILWVATNDGGLNRFDPVSNQSVKYTYNSNDKWSISSNALTAILEDRSGNLWIGTSDSGLNRFDKKSKRFFRYLHDPNDRKSISSNEIISLFEDKRGELWVGTRSGGLNKYIKSTDSFISYQETRNSKSSISSNYVLSFFESDNSSDPLLWIGTWNGLNKLELKEINSFLRERKPPAFIHYFNDTSDKNSLSDNRIISLKEDKDGILWVGTYGGGLNKIAFFMDAKSNKETATIKSYSIKDGLPSDIIFGILEGEDNYLWLSTNNGLSRFNKKNETFTNFTSEDGLQSSQFYWGAYCKRKNGELIFGGINGFNAFYPREIASDTFNSPVVITSFRVLDGMRKQPEAVYETKEISLPYENNSFSFEFSSLDYSAPEKNQYAYMLDGFDKNWIENNNKRFASYTNVNPGEYLFRVKGTNSNGRWNKREASIKIIIVPPFWLTIWFRILSIALIAGALIVLYKRRIRKVNRRNQQLMREIEERNKIEEQLIRAKETAERSERLRSEFLAQMSHEIRTPINSILSFTSLLKAELEDSLPEDLKPSFSIIENGGRRLIRTIDMILNMSAIQTGVFEIKPSKIDVVKDVLAPLVGEFTTTAKSKNLEMNLRVNTDKTAIFADLYTVTQTFSNLIDNAIKYTKEGSVNISVERPEGGFLIVKVQDTGMGVSKEFIPYLFDAFTQEETGYSRRFEGTGLGLSLVKKFTEMNNSEIFVTSEKGKGTIFVVKFHSS